MFDVIPVDNNKVYLVSPGHYLLPNESALQIVPRSMYEDRINCSIDIFLESLAKDESFHKNPVFFSGYGSDGAIGASLIKKAG